MRWGGAVSILYCLQLRPRTHHQQFLSRYCSSRDSDASISTSPRRFWAQTIYYNVDNANHNPEEVLLKNNVDIARIETGFAFVGSQAIPIQSGKFQYQHTSLLPNSSQLTVCGFLPRAGQVDIAPSEEERPIDEERRAALDVALENVANITADTLLGAEFAGTPPARIYRSFVSPRPNAVHILEPVERAAARTANQIELGVRQVLADRASYLRNTDKSQLQLQQTLNPIAVVLDNVRSAFNVGSIYRTAETAGVAEVVTCGITCHPPHPKLMKTALSSVETVSSRHFESAVEAVIALKVAGYTIVVMETTDKSEEYTETEYPRNVALVVGNEVTGVDTRIMDMADKIVQIPTYGVKNSLNVASALPIVLFEILRQWRKST